jgi:putative addiction module antidote
MKTVKIRKIGNSLGVVLPKDVLAMLNAGEGDELQFQRDGKTVTVSVGDAEVDAMLERAESIMQRRHKVLKALSK